MSQSKEVICDEVPKPKKTFGTRHYMTFMLFLGMANAYVMRTNMSVAIVAMVNHTAIEQNTEVFDEECFDSNNNETEPIPQSHSQDGEFAWSSSLQGYILASFFYGYVATQIPFGILAKRYGALRFLGWGMLVNSVFAFFVPIAAHKGGWVWLCVVRLIQGLGEGPIVPCTHALLAKWIPPNERSRMGAFVYAGAQFGTVISMPLSGLLAEHSWPSIFYVFGAIGTVWCIFFLWTCEEDPQTHSTIDEDEKKYIVHQLWGTAKASNPPIPWKSLLTSLPFFAILLAHMAQNYGYETLMTELPTYMKQVLKFSIRQNGILSALPYLAMWIFSNIISFFADYMIESGRFTHTITRKIINSIGQYGPAICLIIASYTGCNRYLTVAILTIGLGLNGGIYSGFKINHLDITPRFAGILMAITNCSANFAGLLAPMAAGNIIEGKPTIAQWRIVFLIAASVYIVCATFYNIFATGERQKWDNPELDDQNFHTPKAVDNENGLKKRKNVEETKY